MLATTAFLASCSKEARIAPTEEFGFEERFSPKEDELPKVKEMYKQYDLWLRLAFKDPKEVTNSILAKDESNRYGATAMDEHMKPSAIMFVDTLLHNVSKEFVQKIFPKEFFFVKTYNGSFWKQDIFVLGRNRLIVCWPNERSKTQPITIPETHYYQDSVLTRMVWGSLSGMLTQRLGEKIPEFEKVGMSYDNGKSVDDIRAKYPSKDDEDQMNKELDLFAAENGFISASGSRSYESDLGQWFSLITTESFDNIQSKYLDNSQKRTEKYRIFTEYLLTKYNWDIQASGDKYREKLNSFQ